jgi:thiaminase (transcriptional activator TenA)
MTLAFADELRQHSTDTGQNILNHRFITELSSNTLPMNKFLFYLKQDHYFLEEFSKFLQSAMQKAIHNKMREWLDSLYISTVNFEMKMQRQLVSSLDVLLSTRSHASVNASSFATKHNIVPTKTTLNYIAYLEHVSSSGTFSEIVSFMAPCPWTYLEIAQQLSKFPIKNEVYSNWVRFYSSEESCKQVDEIKQILNMLGQTENEESKNVMKNHFSNACKFELLFWEMAYNLH